MALKEEYSISFNNSSSTSQDLSNYSGQWMIWSSDDDIYVEEDGDADSNSFLLAKNSVMVSQVGCSSIGVLGKAGSGTAYLKSLPLYEGVTAKEVFDYWALRK